MNNAKNEGSDASRLALALLKGTAVGIGAAAVLMPILALAAYSSPDPSKLTVYLGYAAFALAAAVSGIAAAKFTGGGMLPGAISAAGLSVLVFAVSHRRRKRDLSRRICRVSLRRGPARGAVRSSRGKAQAEKTREALIAEESTAQTIAVSRIIHAAEMPCSRSATA